MSKNNKAFQWALGLTVAYFLGSIAVAVSRGESDLSGELVLRFFAALVMFPIVFVVVRLFGKDKPVSENKKSGSVSKLAGSKWANILAVGISVAMFFGMFLPDILSGVLQPIYYLGALFWIVVFYFGVKNLLKIFKGENI